MPATSTLAIGAAIKDTNQFGDSNVDRNGRRQRGEDASTLHGQSVVGAQTDIEAAIRTILSHIGEDPDREGLQKTPARYAKALLHLTKGYTERVQDVVNDAIFTVDNKDFVIVRDIDISNYKSKNGSLVKLPQQ
ncbi:hypothetical protein PFICI_08252 [Pestalotiopsis fici W106-1]|uniref:GTP cyclohydrolase 1 n=1 Tax=Pestalotiopsis fici (strain W106-1 / CGMCC3.15140) TaxID=1229662 RepID=W3X3M5_PESFW|nr:uncharacterized protein PFICI_08252 [Pestalotiopsis fici W106-1]ETS80723.1 hypothetical protein PFICI_08252 [Pestalotiopsis fici W106-1]